MRDPPARLALNADSDKADVVDGVVSVPIALLGREVLPLSRLDVVIVEASVILAMPKHVFGLALFGVLLFLLLLPLLLGVLLLLLFSEPLRFNPLAICGEVEPLILVCNESE